MIYTIQDQNKLTQKGGPVPDLDQGRGSPGLRQSWGTPVPPPGAHTRSHTFERKTLNSKKIEISLLHP